MASKGIKMGLALILVIMLWNGAPVQSGYTSVLLGLAPCLNYIIAQQCHSNSSPNLIHAFAYCLLLSGGASLGIDINQTLALALLDAYNVHTLTVSQCNSKLSITSFAIFLFYHFLMEKQSKQIHQ
ncbi:hypothetical protein ACSBR2_031995 [Camellia fascicularis]